MLHDRFRLGSQILGAAHQELEFVHEIVLAEQEAHVGHVGLEGIVSGCSKLAVLRSEPRQLHQTNEKNERKKKEKKFRHLCFMGKV